MFKIGVLGMAHPSLNNSSPHCSYIINGENFMNVFSLNTCNVESNQFIYLASRDQRTFQSERSTNDDVYSSTPRADIIIMASAFAIWRTTARWCYCCSTFVRGAGRTALIELLL